MISILEEPIEPEEEQPESKYKKVFLFIISLLLVILIISYIFVSYPISNILQGQIESNLLQDNKMELDDFTIYFNEETNQELQAIYHAEQKVEFSVCLQGRKIGFDTQKSQDENFSGRPPFQFEKEGVHYQIESLYQPEMFDQRFNHVRFESCSNETLIMLHSHPYKSCLASETDINTLERTKLSNPDILLVIMCEPQRFSVYS